MNSSGCRGEIILGGIILDDENFLSNNDLKVWVNGQVFEDFGFVKITFVEDESEVNHGEENIR